MADEKGGSVRFYKCGCFTTDNIFLEDYKLHVRFTSEQQFRQDYEQLLRGLGCVTQQQFDDVLGQISQEVERRQRLDVTSAERTAAVRQVYRPLHPHLYRLKESFLAPQFRQLVDFCRGSEVSEEALKTLMEEEAERVYRLPVFERSFCAELLEELEHFEQSDAPKGRPNTMNHFGILLDELGFDEGFITPLRELYLRPVASVLYPDCGGRCLDSHKAFVVKYDMNEDLDLSYHYDNAEVTLNVCLGKVFTEGGLYFGDMKQVPVSEAECREVTHRLGEGLLHRGQHMHGALPISSGQRWNLIVWMRSSRQRNLLCPMCNCRPTLLQAHGFADGFTQQESHSAPCLLT